MTTKMLVTPVVLVDDEQQNRAALRAALAEAQLHIGFHHPQRGFGSVRGHLRLPDTAFMESPAKLLEFFQPIITEDGEERHLPLSLLLDFYLSLSGRSQFLTNWLRDILDAARSVVPRFGLPAPWILVFTAMDVNLVRQQINEQLREEGNLIILPAETFLLETPIDLAEEQRDPHVILIATVHRTALDAQRRPIWLVAAQRLLGAYFTRFLHNAARRPNITSEQIDREFEGLLKGSFRSYDINWGVTMEELQEHIQVSITGLESLAGIVPIPEDVEPLGDEPETGAPSPSPRSFVSPDDVTVTPAGEDNPLHHDPTAPVPMLEEEAAPSASEPEEGVTPPPVDDVVELALSQSGEAAATEEDAEDWMAALQVLEAPADTDDSALEEPVSDAMEGAGGRAPFAPLANLLLLLLHMGLCFLFFLTATGLSGAMSWVAFALGGIYMLTTVSAAVLTFAEVRAQRTRSGEAAG